jgi:hypothetical protein
VHCITCFQSGLDVVRASTEHFVGVVVLWKQMIQCTSLTTAETVKALASMARFIIADLTDARSVLQELQAIVPNLPSLAVRLLLKKSEHEHGMLDTIRLYRSVVENTYENVEDVIASIEENIIFPAEAKVQELRQRN